MTDKFYQTLDFNRIDLDQLRSGEYPRQASYPDSRTYMVPLLRHFSNLSPSVLILDVGGYIGRFSIEAALALRETGCSGQIICFEPGDTLHILERNLRINDVADRIRVLPFAVSDANGEVKFAVARSAKIASRVVPDTLLRTLKLWLRPGWTTRRVKSKTLNAVMTEYAAAETGCFICKIDTEGHEAEVISGLGQHLLANTPHALIIEYWPESSRKQINGQPFSSFLFSNYHVYDIRSSLYPSQYRRLQSFDRLDKEILSGTVTNLDLLLVAKIAGDTDSLCRTIDDLSNG